MGFVLCRSKSWHWLSGWAWDPDKWRCGFRTDGQGVILFYNLKGSFGIWICLNMSFFSFIYWGFWMGNDLQDQIEADRSRLWVLEEMLWESNWRKQTVAERSSGTESTETFPTVLPANESTNHPHHVPLMWACCCPTFIRIINRRSASSSAPSTYGRHVPPQAHPHESMGPSGGPVLWAASSVVIKHHKQGHFGECKKFVCILMILYVGMSNV